MSIDFTVFKGSSSGEIVESKGHRDLKPTEAVVKISHCSLCGTDELFLGTDMGLGHEGVGTITEVGSAVSEISDFKVGDRVGLGWFHKFCRTCDSCVKGRQDRCENMTMYSTADWDQGCLASHVAWDVSTLFHIPEEISSKDAGPLMCAGASVWGPLYSTGLRAGDRVGILGVGGLGHLAIQFASKLGMVPVVFSRTEDKKQAALDFGAAEFHLTDDSADFSGIKKLQTLLITTSANPDLKKFLPILSMGVTVFPLTMSPAEISISPMTLILGNIQIIGSGIASPSSVRAMLAFAARQNIRSQIEEFPMTKDGIVEAVKKLRDGKMRYRGVMVAQS
ncbi:unnamed protein product [Clonostachys rosea]|uniref:Enoyl reductase (ER) domain-containing protein n=1 Tax=Bionectria ochroleuca TaxID=29856 RepID=A0ABY6TW78_BIOOC|nr:unnamed protein product [Clonostachys rosea]